MVASYGSRSALIIGHPGHETLLHHWIEREHPVVFILTDGSGGGAAARTRHSRRLIEGAGASCGSVFGVAPDRLWYDALLHADAELFESAVQRIADGCEGLGVSTIVSDPVELFNPIHDLTNALAHAVRARLEARAPAIVEMLSYPIERPDWSTSRPNAALAIDAGAAARKAAAILAYEPLASEYPHYRELACRDHELLMSDTPGFAWPRTLVEEPYYERFGRQRLRERRYNTLITYAEHVRPMARHILKSAGAA